MRLLPGLLCAAAAAALLATVGAPDPESAGRDPRILVARLGGPTARDRDEAEAALARLGADAVPTLRVAARSSDPEVRSRSRALLDRLDGEPDRRAREASVLVRVAAPSTDALVAGSELDLRAGALGPEVGDALARVALRVSHRTFVDGPLARALARYATPEALGVLATTWRNDRLVPSAALDAARDLDAALLRRPETARAHRAAAAQGIEILGDVLAPREPPRRRAGLALLAAFAGADASETLLRAASDPDAGVRCESARVLARHLPSDGAPTLRGLAADRDASVRVAALEALLTLKGILHPEPAVAAAEDDVAAVRRAAAELLGLEATAAELPVLRRLAEDPSLQVRAAARRAMRTAGAVAMSSTAVGR